MKAKIRKTGEIVDIIAYDDYKTRSVFDRVNYIDSKGVEHPNEHLNYYWDFEPIEQPNFDSNSDEHWQYVKEYAAIAAMQGLLFCAKGAFSYDGRKDVLARAAVECADAIVAELKLNHINKI